MQEADNKECPHAHEGKFHNTHPWIDSEGTHSCPGLGILPTEEVMARLGEKAHLRSLLYLAGDLRKVFVENVVGDVGVARQAPEFSDNDPLFSDSYLEMQRKLHEQGGSINTNILMGPRTEFAVRTMDWTIADFRKALYDREQEVIELKEMMYRLGEKITKNVNKLLRRAGE